MADIQDSYKDYFINLLNEVLHGFRVEAKSRLHMQREKVALLFQRLNNEYDSPSPISENDAEILLEAAQACNREFEGDEFKTRLGITRLSALRVEQVLKGKVELLSKRG